MRFGLRSIFGFVAFIAGTLTSLMQPWRSWGTSIWLTMTVFLLLMAIPAAVFACRRERPFYVGFAVVGWGYLVLAYSPWFEADIGRQLLAMSVAEWVCVAVTDSLGDIQHFLKATHALFMLGLAVTGGVVIDRCYKHKIEAAPALDVSRCEDQLVHSSIASLRRAQ